MKTLDATSIQLDTQGRAIFTVPGTKPTLKNDGTNQYLGIPKIRVWVSDLPAEIPCFKDICRSEIPSLLNFYRYETEFTKSFSGWGAIVRFEDGEIDGMHCASLSMMVKNEIEFSFS